MKLEDIKNKTKYLKRMQESLAKEVGYLQGAEEIVKEKRIAVFRRKGKIKQLERLIREEL